jgi:exosome complex component RRP40
MAATEAPIVLPGDAIDPSLIPTSNKKRPLRLGPGLRHVPPDTLQSTVAGELITDPKKNTMYIEYNSRRVRLLPSSSPSPLSPSHSTLTNNHPQYIPSQNDLIIGQIHHSSGDLYYVTLNPHAPQALLPHLSFESATKKTRPQLDRGQVIYARVTMANKHMDPELECVSQQTGKSEGLGPLSGGTVFNVSLGLARRLMLPRPREDGGVAVLDVLAEDEGLVFETAVGRNGKVWVSSESVRTVVIVGRALAEVDERGAGFGEEMQRKLVRRLVRDTKG